ncbi:hypothetical protein [Acidocella sp.]|uniref:hypothetical protein n=1 Tax=Acidocella sp. TaxID=50710 RepID=UPI003D08F269
MINTLLINSSLPPAIIVHGLADVRLARRPARPVTLLSAPGAGLSWGCAWWRELLTAGGHEGPALLDCAGAPGRAAEALAAGLAGVILAPCPAWDEVAALARHKGALLRASAPPALDLRLSGAEKRLLPWLGG